MTAYYNEFDPFAAAWLRNLITAGHIAPGDVDERSIEDVSPDDLRPYMQCHFFAGIGVWSHALRGAGWSDDEPIWTGSCPCQPFSAAGKGGGFADERHLWPAFFHLIQQCDPAIIIGEQVASKDGLAWLDLVRADVEGTGRAFAAADLCAAGVGAPHIRQRTFWLADATHVGVDWRRDARTGRRTERAVSGSADRLADAEHYDGRADEQGRRQDRRTVDGGSGEPLWVGDARSAASERDAGTISGTQAGEHGARVGVNGCVPVGLEYAGAGVGQGQPCPTNGFWSDADWLYCRDGKWRPVEPGTFPLVNGAANRVGRLRGYGNAIVAPVAQTFIEAVIEARASAALLT